MAIKLNIDEFKKLFISKSFQITETKLTEALMFIMNFTSSKHIANIPENGRCLF